MRIVDFIKNTKKSSFSNILNGFTIIELIVVISIIGILSSIVIINYSSWRQSITVAQLKSDLGIAASAMENARNFSDSGYPTDVGSLTNITKSEGVTLTGGSTDGGKTYCVQAYSPKSGGLYYHIHSTNANRDVQLGSC